MPGQEFLGFCEAPTPTGGGPVRVPGCQSGLVERPESGLVVFADLEVEMDCVPFLVAAVGYFAHGQAGLVHHVPFRVPRHVPASHAGHLADRPLKRQNSRISVDNPAWLFVMSAHRPTAFDRAGRVYTWLGHAPNWRVTTLSGVPGPAEGEMAK